MEEQLQAQITQDVAKATEQVETKILERESRRSKNMYIVVGFVSFIGMGVITQLVDFYASEAVDDKLSEARQELESAKIFSQLMAFATNLHLSDSVSHNDRDTVVALLKTAQTNETLRKEVAFIALLEKIIDSISAIRDSLHTRMIFEMYESECLSNYGISYTLIHHFGWTYLASVDIESLPSKRVLGHLDKTIFSMMSLDGKGIAYAYQLLSTYKKSGEILDSEVTKVILSLDALNDDERQAFLRTLETLANLKGTPEDVRVANVVEKFINDYQTPLSKLIPADD